MATVRIIQYNTRIATGKPWKDIFLQVFPEVYAFKSEDEWKSFWAAKEEHVKKEEVIPRTKKPSPKKKHSSVKTKRNAASQAKGWNHMKTKTFTAPPGTYYIGDLCYALHHDIYDGVFGGTSYDTGLYEKDDMVFFLSGTFAGDGAYKGSDDFEYCVDSGTIGICSLKLVDFEKTSYRLGRILEFKTPVECHFKDGLFRFGDVLTIWTGYYEEGY